MSLSRCPFFKQEKKIIEIREVTAKRRYTVLTFMRREVGGAASFRVPVSELEIRDCLMPIPLWPV
jgi:ACT domain-containing protein